MGARSHFATLVVAQLFLLAFCTSAFGSAGCPGDDLQPTAATAYDGAMALRCDMNEARVQHGLAPLRWDWRLWSAAQAHAGDMAAREYFAHDSPEGATLLDRVHPTGYLSGGRTLLLAENLGFGTSGFGTPASIMLAWLNSPPHRENLLDPRVHDVGIGLADGAPSQDDPVGHLYVADFGARADSVRPRGRTVRARRR